MISKYHKFALKQRDGLKKETIQNSFLTALLLSFHSQKECITDSSIFLCSKKISRTAKTLFEIKTGALFPGGPHDWVDSLNLLSIRVSRQVVMVGMDAILRQVIWCPLQAVLRKAVLPPFDFTKILVSG
jgi:hypothetical protein